ncbi:meiosis-specific nuclear structural protein 1-like [Ostrea edulis]|uniref:meiosis-specific nuclear structural protein 1-like n=1 Tax=Ostrea edulis TaxID=37623 RepID=UPI00209427BE|nr:meiosis-specific nuclear structural protein 1-like [Ostrea edulis]XP_056004121.1 meiosis-specific nuclear structural protein 1-like [Ostrea edulis]
MTTVRRALTGGARERQLENMRRQEDYREDTIRRLHEEKRLEANMSNEERISEKRFIRRTMMEQKEREMEEAILKAQRDRLIREEQMLQEERLAAELEKRKLDGIRDEKMRQQIRETSLELRELEAKLRSAYMNKERTAQIAEKEALKFDKMKRDSEIAHEMKVEHERAEEASRQREMEKYREQIRYQQELERQLEEQEQKKQQAYEEFLKEKLMIDEIVRKIYEEDQRERELTLSKKKATQRYIEDFKQAREEWKVLEKERMEEENRKILHFSKLQEERENARMANKKQKEEAMARVQHALAEDIAAKDAAREEMERIRMELYLEEQEEKERQKERDDMERKIRQRLELQSQHAQQMHFKNLRRKAEEDEEEEFRQQMMAKFAEDDRIEQMNANKRRMKQLEHKRAVEKLIDDRKVQFAADRERELEERREEERMEAFRKQIIEEERQKLLQEHAMRLLGYLPKGVIRDSGDLSMLGQDFKEAYSKRQIDPFDEEAWDQRR